LELVRDWGWLRDSLTSGIWQILLKKLSLIWRVCFLQVGHRVLANGLIYNLVLAGHLCSNDQFKGGFKPPTSDSCLVIIGSSKKHK
jgi:hypothetical protein